MPCGRCQQTRRELITAVRQGNIAGAVQVARKGAGQMLEHLKKPPPATAQFSRKR
jgi:hypothetical protein